jgi:hypothetical protein
LELPSRRDATVFAAKAFLLRQRRWVQDRVRPVPALEVGFASEFPIVLASNRSRLWTETDVREERLEMGKVHNLRIVCRQLNGRVVPVGGVFSFWRHVGRPTRGQGFVEGRQIVSGCVVPAIAGGICQLTNVLFQMALDAGFEIVERHPHTRRLAQGSPPDGRDATVAWNYIDLRFRPPGDVLIVARMTEAELIVEMRSRQPLAGRRKNLVPLASAPMARSCETCGEEECFRHPTGIQTARARAAWLVDQVQPEFLALAQSEADQGDLLMSPTGSSHPKLARYAWSDVDAGRWSPTPYFILRRSWESRRLAEQGAARRSAMLRHEADLARRYAARLPYDARHIVVAQPLLPELWRHGALGGRSFTVLMTRLPLGEIHRRLDEAHARHPQRALLNDFRADAELVEMEREALAAARELITPHADIARLFGARARLIPWVMPKMTSFEPGDRVLFPGPTVGRKGAFEVRDLARELGLKLTVGGSMLEGSDFWAGLDVVRAGTNPFDGCRLVLQPALIEDQPRRLLSAIASGLPVVASPACGLEERPGLTLIDPQDREAMSREIQLILAKS